MNIGFWWQNLRETNHLEGNIIMDLKERGWKNVDWINLAHDRDQWEALVNTINVRVP
jgi:hypothetical protein